MPKVPTTLKNLKVDLKKSPVWKGPSDPGPNGGVTQSMLGNFLICRERFRLKYVEGLRPVDKFNKSIEYGQMWHVCEEQLSKLGKLPQDGEVYGKLVEYCRDLCKKYPLQQEEIQHWYCVCNIQLPLYVKYWAKHPDVKDRTPVLQEEVFDVPYELPSGRTVRLRGKFDAVDLIGKGKNKGVYLQENKTKADIDQELIGKQLSFDLQTMLYLVALQEHPTACYESEGHMASDTPPHPIKGVRYNVIRRPLAGGKGSITQHKATEGSKCPKCKGLKDNSNAKLGEGSSHSCPKCQGKGRIGAKPGETLDAFYQRLSGIIEGSPQDFFMRWKVEISQADIARFRRQFLDPILENLCDWYEWIMSPQAYMYGGFNSGRGLHWTQPFGLYSPLMDGGATEYDLWLATGSSVGLRRSEELFTELR